MVLLNLVPFPNGTLIPAGTRPVLFVELLQSLDYCDDVLIHKRSFTIIIDATNNICDSTTNIPTLAPVSYLVTAV